MARKKQILFSTHLMTSVVILVTGSVLLISIVLYVYLGKRLESDFQIKMIAQKGRVETILKNRTTSLSKTVTDLSKDNSLRVTMMMDDTSQMEDQAKQFNSGAHGVSFYVQKTGNESFYPLNHPNLTAPVIKWLETDKLESEIIEEVDRVRLLWWFNAPIMHKDIRMGSVFVLYDMLEDDELITTIDRIIDDDILIFNSDGFIGLTCDTTISLDKASREKISNSSGLLHLNPDMALLPLDEFNHLYFSSSRKDLLAEKKNVFWLIGIFTFSVLTVSVLFSVLLGRRMTRPLQEMANKAYQISSGTKNISFETRKGDYAEFNRLSEVFNNMLAKLKEMEEWTRYTELMENVDDAVYLINSKGKIIQANEATRLQLGYVPSALLDARHETILPPKDARMLQGQLFAAKESQTHDKMTFETFHIAIDGKKIPVEIKALVITYREQEVVLNVARDIRERKIAENALRESEERYRSVVESSHDGIFIIDHLQNIIYANAQLHRILGYPPNDIGGKKVEVFFPDSHALFATSAHGEKSKTPPNDPKNFDFIKKDGEHRHGSIRTTNITDSTGNQKTVVQLLDISDQLQAEQEKKQLEAQLLHAQKMEAIGTLAGGVAHDFNNLLQVINGYTELLIAMKDENDPDAKHLGEIRHAAKRANDLTDQLLTFSRKSESRSMSINLNDEVKQGYRLLERTLTNMIETKLYLDTEIKPIKADPGRLQQVIMNLGVNARDAMPDGGKLVIETKNVFLDEAHCRKYLEATPGDYVLLSITDNGHGMDQETTKHIFEPFFTTKQTGKGTGLGMAIVYGIIQDAGGYITCNSKIDIGTTFEICFPVVVQSDESPPASAGAVPATDALPPMGKQALRDDEASKLKGDETVLLVDDETRIRDLGVTLLSKFGYTVLTAVNGLNALAVYHEKGNGKEIDLVILDLIMPEMDGRQCLKKLRELNPEVKVIMSSGYSSTRFSKDFSNEGAKAFIRKPYDLKRMLEAIRDVLELRKK